MEHVFNKLGERAMGGKVEACVECTQKCLKIHEKKKISLPAVTSFFKVMIGAKFAQVLV